jgi:ATP-binding cassette, subfamily B, bacterial
MSHVQDLELAYFEDRSSGGLMTVLNDDVNQLERFLDLGANEVILTATNVLLVGLAFAVISPSVALLAFLPIPVIIAESLRYQRALEKRYDAVRAAAGRIAHTLTNNLGGITTIKAFTAEAREVERVAVDSRAYSAANAEAIRYSSAFIPLIRMAILAGFTMTLLVGGRATLRGDLEVGLFSSLVYMTQRLLWPLTRLGETLDLYQRAMASCRRIFGLLDVRPSIQPGLATMAVPVRGGQEHHRQAPPAPLRTDRRHDHARRHPPARSHLRPAAGNDRLCEPGRVLVPGHRAGEPHLWSTRGHR